MSEGLAAWIEGAAVGRLQYAEENGLFRFEYTAEWLGNPHAYPLSPPLNVTNIENEAALHSARVRRFFENLLPEGEALEDAARASKTSLTNLMGLMRVLGRETTGALTLLPENIAPETLPPAKRTISPTELSERIRERAQLPFSIWDGRVRMSIAGAQDKLAVYKDDKGAFNLVEGALASTHILKPEPRGERLAHLGANEHFCMRFAAALGIAAAEVELIRVPEPVLVIRRFDRVPEPDRVRRIHIIDACQALDLPPAYKYERNFGGGRDVAHIRDGASYEKIFGLSRISVGEAAMKQQLIRWVLLQTLIGNSDAHGKNLSFYVRPHGLELAPAYDLVSTLPYENIEHEWAMGIGDCFDMDDVSPYDWADFAQRCDIPRRLLVREMQRMAKLAQAEIGALLDWPGYNKAERKFLRKIARLIGEHAKRLDKSAGELASVKLS